MSEPTIPADVLMHAPPLTDEDLADVAHIDTMPGLPDEAVPETVHRARAWEPATEQEAEWCMAKASAAGRRMDEVARLAAEYHEQIEQWAADASRSARSESGFFRSKLEGYLRRRHDDDPKLRTVKLPSGTLRITVRQTGSVVVADPEKLMLWLLKNGDKVPAETVIKRPEPTVLVSELRKYVKAEQDEETGTWRAVVVGHADVVGTPPGIDVLPPADPTYTINPA